MDKKIIKRRKLYEKYRNIYANNRKKMQIFMKKAEIN